MWGGNHINMTDPGYVVFLSMVIVGTWDPKDPGCGTLPYMRG